MVSSRVSVGSPDMARARRGQLNPQLYQNAFFSNQINTQMTASVGFKRDFGSDPDINKRDFSPVFSFDRFGRSETQLPDGRRVLIAGSHEDFYDPDYFIYNDVCVLGGAGSVEYVIYSIDDFPPTDHHTATLMGDRIWIIGNLGYKNQRSERSAQVLSLDITDWRMKKIAADGDGPGWISGHSSIRSGDEIFVSGGRYGLDREPNSFTYALNVQTTTWRKVS